LTLVINSITGETINIEPAREPLRWLNSTTPWCLPEDMPPTIVDETIEHPPLIHDILKWAGEKLPLWQRDAIRRLFQQEGILSEDDYSQLYLMLKASHGVPSVSTISPVPLALSDLPAIAKAGERVTLRSMHELENVNRIASGQKLEFGISGMTIVYGGNGAGKSGYVRVLKSVCRSRGVEETVIPDASDSASYAKIPAAKFDITANGISESIQWTANSTATDDLAKISVFDSKCARAYLTEERDVAFLPYGLDVVEKMANMVLPEITKRLNHDSESINVDASPFNHLLSDTEVGKIIKSLGTKTKVEDLDALSKLSVSDLACLDKLNSALSNTDPAAKASELRLSADRVKAFIKRIEQSYKWVSDDSIVKLRGLMNAAQKSSDAEKLAAQTLRSGEHMLLGTGEPVWKALFESARKYSTEIAYPDCDFPHVGAGAFCPLCQQDLAPAADRLKRFEDYIQNDVAKTAENDRKALASAKTKIKGADLDIYSDKSIIDELNQLDADIDGTVLVFRTAMEARQQWMLNGLEGEVSSICENPRPRLRKLAANQLRACRTYLKAVDEKKKIELTRERDELAFRKNLSECVDGVKSLLERMEKKRLLKLCEKDLKTRHISNKSKEFSSNAVTAELKLALDKEFTQLGIGHIQTKLKERTVKGKVKHQLLLDLPSNVGLDSILSEGEQRAIALGSFLAELHIANHSCGIIFDDPVSSLDHVRRLKVAKRLAIESKSRQVIVFTHDVSFLSDLRSECEKQDVNCCSRYLEQVKGYFGNVTEGLPWMHKSYKERIVQLEKAHRELTQFPWPPYPSEDLVMWIHSEYNHLRSTIERVVEEFILGGTVKRFDSYIKVSNLNKVVGLEQNEVDELMTIMERCNDLVNAHDPSSIRNDPPPTPTELKQDIVDLKKLLERIKVRRSNL
jgi:ABC-type lipoprotein export system ATPase subunit